MQRCVSLMVFGAVVGLAAMPAAAAGVLQVEGFDVPPATGGFSNPYFTHALVATYEGYGPSWGFTGPWGVHSPEWGLGLWPAMDVITLGLGPGEYADWAGVWITTNACAGRLEVFGTLDHYIGGTNSGEVWVDTTGVDLGEIFEIRLWGYETVFDDLTVRVLPEPATLALLAAGGLAALIRRRR